MDFAKQLKQYQYEKHMTNDAFAKHIGKRRAWLQRIYSKNPDIPKSTLGELTMYMLNEKLNIPYDVMEEYNTYVISTRGENNTKWVD